MALVNVILITSAFPFLPGEQFIESEMKFWEQQCDVDLRLIPLSMGSGQKRLTPPNTQLDTRIAELNLPRSATRPDRLIRGLLSKGMLQEFKAEADKALRKAPYMLASVSKIEAYKRAFNSIFPRMNRLDDTLIYCYWHNEACYALQDLKSTYGYRLISRVHRHDLYSNERPHGYMPSKRRYTSNIDALYALSPSAILYLMDEYKFPESRLRKAGLGVLARNISTLPSEEGSLRIVSCSNMVEVKNIEMIVDLLHELSCDRNLQIHWTHIGTGPLKESIENYCQSVLGNIEHLSYSLAGHFNNEEVFDFYHKSKVDFFVNVSHSEGQPVSIMEALSCSIPVVGPDVGGVSEMLEDGINGILFKHPQTVSDIARRLRSMRFLKDGKYRRAAFDSFSRLFDADKVYPEFIHSILESSR